MRRALRALVVALALLVSGCAGPRALGVNPPDGQRDKGFSDSRSTAEALDATFAPRKIAVVVGIDQYDDSAFPALKWARNDAAEVARILQDPEYGGFDRVVTLTEPSQVRRDRILAELVALRSDLRRQDTLVVFISSHGTMTLDGSGEPHLYLVARDTRPGDLRGTGIELAELQRYFSEMRAERKALILDACYNGQAKSALQPTVRQRIERLDDTPVLSRKVRLGESEAHLFASTFGRPAREDDTLQHGVYTYHLLDALTWNQLEADTDGDGVINVYEAHDHARRKTLSFSAGAQVPEAYFRVVGHNDVVLVGAPEARLASEVGAVYWYGAAGEEFDGATLMIDGQTKGVLPATYAVPPGRHRVRVVGSTGAVLQDRTVLVTVGEALAADALSARPALYNGFVSIAPRIRFSLSDRMRPLTGRAYAGVEAAGGYRFLGPVRGLTIGGGIGWAPHQARFVDGDAVRFEPRHVVWGHASVGYRLALPHGSLGASYRLRLQGATALTDPACEGHVACNAWLWGSQGAALEQTLSLGRRWSLRVEEELGIGALDPDGAGVRPVVDIGLSVGIEVGL